MGEEISGATGPDTSGIGGESGEAKPARKRVHRGGIFGSRNAAPSRDGGPPETEGGEGTKGQTIRVDAEAQQLGPNPDGPRRPKARPSMGAPARRDAATDTISMVDDVARIALGDFAAFTPDERTYISRPLSRIYERNAEVAETVSRYSDPVMLAGGIILWALRVWAIVQYNRAVRRQQAQAVTPLATPPHGPDIETRVGLAPEPPSPVEGKPESSIVNLFAREG